MGTELSVTLSDEALDKLAGMYGSAAEDLGSGSANFAKMDTKGVFTFGVENSVIEADEEWAANIDSFSKGWICWKDSKAIDEKMAKVSSGVEILERDLPDHGPYAKDSDGWKKQSACQFKSLETGDDIVFKATSKGGLGAFSKFGKEIVKQMRRDPKNLVPVLHFKSDSYANKTYGGRTFFPILEVVRWSNDQELLMDVGTLGRDASKAAAVTVQDKPALPTSDAADTPPWEDEKKDTPSADVAAEKSRDAALGASVNVDEETVEQRIKRLEAENAALKGNGGKPAPSDAL